MLNIQASPMQVRSKRPSEQDRAILRIEAMLRVPRIEPPVVGITNCMNEYDNLIIIVRSCYYY